jgi:methionine synthase II (cobalamin-independent)
MMATVIWNFCPTCIGSLPHTDPSEAVELVLKEVRKIPFWPQLPSRDFNENMYAQYAYLLPGVEVDPERKRVTVDLGNYDPESFYMDVISERLEAFAYDEAHFSGFFDLMSQDFPDEAIALKGQITGPVSTGLQIFDQEGKAALYDEAYCEIIRKGLNMMARWQEDRLSEKCENTILFIDEPSLSLMGTPFASIRPDDAIRWIDEVAENLKGTVAIHCCGNTDWPTVMSTCIDILSLDAYDYGYTISLYPEEVEAFLDRGGAIAWGLIPNLEETFVTESTDALVRRGIECIDSLVTKGMDEDLLVTRSLVTPQCGLGGIDEPLAPLILRSLGEVSKKLREHYSLED